MTGASDWCFPGDTVAFLAGLKANNTRDWFAQNKARYEQAVKQPAQAFCDELCPRLEALTGVPHRAKIFRIHRDVRFSKDKTPYNTHLHIAFASAQEAGAAPAWFFALEPGKLIFGAGCFGFDKPVLERYRQKVAGGGGGELQSHLERLVALGMRVSEPDLKRVPKGYDPEAAHAPLLLRKGLSAWSDYADTGGATAPGLIALSLAEYGRLKPLFDWLAEL